MSCASAGLPSITKIPPARTRRKVAIDLDGGDAAVAGDAAPVGREVVIVDVDRPNLRLGR